VAANATPKRINTPDGSAPIALNKEVSRGQLVQIKSVLALIWRMVNGAAESMEEMRQHG
jgi:hypothetical protein